MILNHKGQTLVLFVLLLPVLLMIFGFLIDTGNLYLEKRKLEQTVKRTLQYGIEHIEEENIEETLHKQLLLNLKKFESDQITVVEDRITIEVNKNVESIIGFLTGKQTHTITYKKMLQKK